MNKHLTGILLPLTARQQETLDFMWRFYQENDQLPPAFVIAKHFGLAINAIKDRLIALKKKGYIEKNTVEKYRFAKMFRAEQESSTEAV